MDMATRLDLFLDVVNHGSFAKAADLRNLDRSVLSKQIKVLEDDLGIRLLNRSTRSLSLTDAGAEILKQAESVRNLLADTQRIAESYHSQPKGQIKITGPTPFGYLYLTQAVNNFMKKYPDVHISLHLDDRRSDIIGEQYDIAFRVGVLSDSNLIAKKIANNPIAILASQAFIEKYGEPQTPEELMQLPAIIYNNGEVTRNKIDFCQSPGCETMDTYTMKGKYKVNQARAILSAAQAGVGYAVVPLFTLEKNIKELGLIPLLTHYRMPKTYGQIHAIYPHRNQTPIVKLFIESVQEIIGTPPIWENYIDDYASMYK
ncbi:LysR family transcriptional regulator [Vibrio sp. TH_r3]|uniref:LysR family transcriptional regulator n=1 Tax=Vibrio sp. TH_r3 TaxID=3082084 RepID=UPI002955B580|nr:LysR family transcriptional regulator [Vibrio sp. TH_r3]MDV7105274.1 LysR family transcriptional regulator [Vibrio sp. TH_r3]